jgi:1-deoxy-D-xylulose-5-phosphate reductoisomerase
MRRVVVLGSTGSIGTQTLDIIAQFPDHLQVVGLAAHRNRELLAEQAERFNVKHTAIYDSPTGPQDVTQLAQLEEADTVVVSVAGVVGLQPTIAAIKAGKDIALASKEVLVAAGEIVMPLVKQHKIKLTPIDSEHSAIFQCLQGYAYEQIDSLILTASGGPFRGKTTNDLKDVTVAQALNHPTWSMGGKITIDSATLMNKGLETIEARWLFDVPIQSVRTVIHPQSVVHSFVKFKDGSALGQCGWPDMRLPIAYALLHPERLPNTLKPWDPTDTPNLTFQEVDHDTFPSIKLAIQSSEVGGTMPAAMNAANEEAANAFLRDEIKFLQIPQLVEAAMAEHKSKVATLENIVETDSAVRQFVRRRIASE